MLELETPVSAQALVELRSFSAAFSNAVARQAKPVPSPGTFVDP